LQEKKRSFLVNVSSERSKKDNCSKDKLNNGACARLPFLNPKGEKCPALSQIQQTSTTNSCKKVFSYFCNGPVTSGIQRSGDALGVCLVVCPLPNSRVERWLMVVIVTAYTLVVTSQYDFIFTFALQGLGEVCW